MIQKELPERPHAVQEQEVNHLAHVSSRQGNLREPGPRWSARDPPHSPHRPSLNSESGAKENKFHVTYVFRPHLAEAVLNTVKKGAHVLVEGSLVSSTYEQANGKGKKTKTAKITSWSIRADVVRKLDRGEPEPQAPASGPDAAAQSSDTSDAASF